MSTGPKININYLSLPGTSKGAGINFGDNNIVSSGYILGAYDLGGYVFKGTNAPNIVKLDVRNLKVPNATTIPNAGIMTLSRTPPSSEISYDSSYTIGVINTIDVSNIFIRTLTSTPNLQIVDTSMAVLGNVIIGKQTNYADTSLDANGNVIVSRLGIATSSVNTNYSLEVSGNIFNSNGFIWQF
jgi:hypothetical protein